MLHLRMNDSANPAGDDRFWEFVASQCKADYEVVTLPEMPS